MKAFKKTAVPRNSELFQILRGIDEEAVAKARDAEGSQVKRVFQKGVTKIDCDNIAQLVKD